MGIYLTDQIGPFIDIHLGEQFYLALIQIKVIWVEAIFYNFLSIFTEKSKNDEASSMDFKIESPNYGNQR